MMWELIQHNRKMSLLLFASMALLLSALGYLIGAYFGGESGGLAGLAAAIGIWIALTLLTVTSGDEILLKAAGAREVSKDVHPRLFNTVEEMKIASGLPAMPRVYIVDDPSPNAFAIGMKPEKSAIAVTAGLVSRLNRDELQGVVAHEMSHIVNRDTQLMTVAGIMLGSIVLISQFFLRSMWFMPSSSRRYRKSGGGGNPQFQLAMIAVTVALAILAPLFARLIYLAISRRREYLADATAAQLTRYPEGLASALEKIASSGVPLETANKATAPMYIVNPFMREKAALAALASTHPPTEERIRILRTMAGLADYRAYQRAYAKIRGKTSAVIPPSGIRGTKQLQARGPSADAEPDAGSRGGAARDAMDIMRAVNGFAFIVCACGLKMKLPPELDSPAVTCPKCGRENRVPVAELAAVGALAGAVTGAGAAPGPPQAVRVGERYEYARKGDGWESFYCACGNVLQLSPAFRGTIVNCKLCGENTVIK